MPKKGRRPPRKGIGNAAASKRKVELRAVTPRHQQPAPSEEEIRRLIEGSHSVKYERVVAEKLARVLDSLKIQNPLKRRALELACLKVKARAVFLSAAAKQGDEMIEEVESNIKKIKRGKMKLPRHFKSTTQYMWHQERILIKLTTSRSNAIREFNRLWETPPKLVQQLFPASAGPIWVAIREALG